MSTAELTGVSLDLGHILEGSRSGVTSESLIIALSVFVSVVMFRTAVRPGFMVPFSS